MNLESLMLAFGVGWAVWVLMRIHRKRKAAQQAARDGNAPAAAGSGAIPAARREPGQMPRLGEPGTIAFNQIKALQRNGFTPDRQWSREEAALILDAVAYLRIVCRDVSDPEDGPPPLEVQNDLLRFILTQQDLRDHVRKWGEEIREGGGNPIDAADADDPPALPRNNQYRSVAGKAEAFLAG
jgi:hypothetical protein